MTDQPILELIPATDDGDDQLNLATYAQRAYLEYALSVVKGRALPDVWMSAPARRANAHRQPEKTANRGQKAREFGGNVICVSSGEVFNLNSRKGWSFAVLP